MLDRYIDDFLQTLTGGVMDSWLAGNLSLQVEQDARGYIHALRHMQNIRLPDLRAFWHIAPLPSEIDPRDKRPSSATGY